MNTAIIGLGSNIDAEKNIETARKIIRERFTVVSESSFLRNPPCGTVKQPDFVNGAILVKTELVREECKSLLKDLERQMGRTKEMIGSSPRVIDFDIHIWNDDIVDPYFYEWPFIRLFVLELMPELKYDHGKLKTI